jgi:hypothetical protein
MQAYEDEIKKLIERNAQMESTIQYYEVHI